MSWTGLGVHPMLPHSSPTGRPAASVCEHGVKSTPSPSGHLGPAGRGRPRLPGKLPACCPARGLLTWYGGAGHLRFRCPEPARGSLFKTLPGGSARAPCPLFSPWRPCHGLGPAPGPHVTSGKGRRAGQGGSCPGRTSSVRSRLPGSSGPLGMVR